MKTPSAQDTTPPMQKLSELIRDVEVAMLTTVGTDERLYSRPMAALELEPNGVLWFFTRKSSGKVDSIRENSHVNLAYGSPSDHRYVSVTGRARIVENPAKAMELWKPSLRAFFPNGLDDPDMALLEVQVEGAEYWDAPSGWLVKMLGFAEGYGGPNLPKGEHERIAITH